MPPALSKNPARRIVLIYILVAAAWILLSDRAVALVAPDVANATRLSIVKGWAFVAFTALLLYHFIRRSFAAERAIREGLAASEARFAQAFQANPSPLAITRETDGTFLSANESFCHLMERPLAELVGCTAADLELYPDAETRDQLVVRLQAEGRLRNHELTLRTGTGQPVHVLVSVERIRVDGQPCLLTAFHDLTLQRRNEAERLRLEAEAQHFHKLESLGTLAGGVAHDMNNILGAIMGMASLVQERHPSDAGLARDMDTLLRAAGRGRDLVRGLTDFARKGLQEPRPTDLNELLGREADLLRRTTLQRIQVDLDLEPDLPLVLGDPGSLSNAVMNLCVNAMDAMPDGGTLRLATRFLAPGSVQLSVTDTGVGMPPEVLQRAMDPFFTTKPLGQGTGLGLSLAFSIAKAHQGRLEIESTPGRGTEVRLVLPAYGPDPALAGGAPAVAAPPDQPPLRVFLVDDDDLVRMTLPAMFEALGHRTEAVASGPEALALLANGTPPDLVVLDVNMPGMDGLEVHRRLREAHPRLPVLFASGLKDVRLERLLDEDPVTAYLPKPFTLPELQRRLAALQGRA